MSYADEMLAGQGENSKLWYSNRIEKPEHIVSHGDHMDLRNWQINQPLFDGRGKWKLEMSAEELEIFIASPAGELMQRGGYSI